MQKKIHILLLLFLTSFQLLSQTAADHRAQPDHVLEFSKAPGYYDTSQIVEILAPRDAVIVFTTDGSIPDSTSRRYTRPLNLKSTVVIRAKILGDTNPKQELVGTFLIDEPESTFMTVSLAVPPDLLFDPVHGLFVEGLRVDSSTWSKRGANFWSRNEIPMHSELFETNGKPVFSSHTGFRIFGGFSRLFPQKSITIVAREEYSDKCIKYPVFGKGKPDKFKFLVLRNGGSDFGKTHFRDAFMTSLTADWDMDQQASRPAHVYLNGDYWGIYNIREKINKHFINAYHDVDKDSLDILEHQAVLKNGSRRHYNNLVRFLQQNDLSDNRNLKYLETQMEVTNFLDHKIAQIYFDNQDAGGNIKFWRPQTLDGRWRWILFDTDWGFGLNDHFAYRNNSLEFHTKPNGPSWPNPPWSTFILRKLLENEFVQATFINRFADHLNTSFETSNVLAHVQDFSNRYTPEIDRHIERWKLKKWIWEKHIEILQEFAIQRPDLVRMHLMDYFQTGEEVNVQLDCSVGGKIILNNHLEIRTSFSGTYFEHIPIKVKVQADYGYRFSHWEFADIDSTVTHFKIRLKRGDIKLRAVFKPHLHPLAGRVIINEISPNNKKSEDWLELFNTTNERINLKDWKLTDLKNTFSMPDISIGPSDYLVVCEDSTDFLKVFPEAYNFIGGLNFGLNKYHEKIQLFAADGAMVDSINYTLPPTDSTFTLSLLLPDLDNTDAENWRIQNGIGTPNAGNPYFIESNIRSEQQFWIEMGLFTSVFLVCFIFLYLKHSGVFAPIDKNYGEY